MLATIFKIEKIYGISVLASLILLKLILIILGLGGREILMGFLNPLISLGETLSTTVGQAISRIASTKVAL